MATLPTFSTAEQFTTALTDRLLSLRESIRTDPLRNPVRELGHELSREMEAGSLTMADCATLIEYLDKEAFAARADHVIRYLDTPVAVPQEDPFGPIVEAVSANLTDFASFKAYWEHRRETIVFTGHPTFALSRAARTRLAESATDATVPTTAAGLPDSAISLEIEHDQAEAALVTAANAVHRLNREILRVARERFPDSWRALTPEPIGLGTWVGYDMDGRTDIGWAAVVRHRLHEKQMRLRLYVERAEALGERVSDVTTALRAASESVDQHCALFGAELSDPDHLVAAANSLTSDDSNITSLKPIVASLGALLDGATAEEAIGIAALRTEMRTFGLGMGDIHFRLNASQIRNAARGFLNKENEADLFGRGALAEISEAIAKMTPRAVNFASLAGERSPSARLFIAMKQILKHVDSDSPIRLLIAECENPVTVLAAIYQAKFFGVEHLVDVCPLFETAAALDRGRRILDVLFGQEAYRTQARLRGRVSIETGFSDAGRFMGQIPAALAIERLQGQLARTMAAHGLQDLSAIIYDTHGESMGRGGHPGGIIDRCLYALSPWARRQFGDAGIALRHEQSFQGGDGYLWFTTPALAERTLAGILAADLEAQKTNPDEDAFYNERSVSLDFFNAVKRRQEELFLDPAYNIALNAMGLSLLPQTGSRKNKRQFDLSADEETSLRRIRAIPHNAILQQLGFLANILGGVGSAMAVEPQAFQNLYQRSDRFGRLMRLVDRARRGSEMKTLIAYMKLFDGSFWATRPVSGGEGDRVENACAVLADQLSEDNRYFAGLQLAARLRSDAIALSRAMRNLGFEETDSLGETRPSLDLLHAVRIALIQRLFLIAAELPAFTPGGAFSRERVMQAVFRLDIDGAASMLIDAFPTEDIAQQARRDMAETADYPGDGEGGDSDLADARVEDLNRLRQMIHNISVGIANHFAAFG